MFDIVFVLVVVFTIVQGGSLPAVARWLRIATPVTPRDIDVESAPLDALGAELMQGGYRQLLLYPFRRRLF